MLVIEFYFPVAALYSDSSSLMKALSAAVRSTGSGKIKVVAYPSLIGGNSDGCLQDAKDMMAIAANIIFFIITVLYRNLDSG